MAPDEINLISLFFFYDKVFQFSIPIAFPQIESISDLI